MNELFCAYGPAENGTWVRKKRISGFKSIIEAASALTKNMRFSTPGHKGRLCAADVTEYDEDEFFPADVVENAEKKAASFYSVRAARLLVGGASLGIKAALLAADTDVVAPVFTHRCAFYGAKLARREIFTFDAGESEGLPGLPTPEAVEAAFASHPGAGAALITSPDYFGRCAPVEEIGRVCEKLGKRLLCDCAHGAHFASRPDLFPLGGERVAAIAALSSHKTLRALTQTAVGTVGDESLLARYDEALALLGTTSPSYLLLSSIESAIEFERENAGGYDALVAATKRLKEEVPCIENDDPMRIVVDCGEAGGKAFMRALICRGVLPEAYYGRYCVFIVTLSDSPGDVDALAEKIRAVLKELK